jgi:hypothetical protein
MMEELVVKLCSTSWKRGLAKLDLWWDRTFGHSLSGRMNKLEIQTLFHGKTTIRSNLGFHCTVPMCGYVRVDIVIDGI